MARLIPTVFRLKSKYIDRDAQLLCSNYMDNNSLAVQIVAPRAHETDRSEIIATISVNVNESNTLSHNSFFAKNYSENEGILECLEQLNLIRCINDGVKVGFTRAPLFELV